MSISGFIRVRPVGIDQGSRLPDNLMYIGKYFQITVSFRLTRELVTQ